MINRLYTVKLKVDVDVGLLSHTMLPALTSPLRQHTCVQNKHIPTHIAKSRSHVLSERKLENSIVPE